MEDKGRVRKDLANYKAASNLKMNETIRKQIAEGAKIYHLGFGQSPFPVPESLQRAMVKHVGKNAYLPIAGIPEFREAVCKFHKAFPTGIPEEHLQIENILIADGSKILIYLLMTIFEGAILLKSPTWTTYKPQTELAGKKQILLDCSLNSQWKITPACIEEAMSKNPEKGYKLLIFGNPCNPCGVIYTEDELRALSLVFRKYNILVLSDEIYGHLAYEGKYISLSKHYPEGTIVTSGLSKWASAGGWRVGYAIFPTELGDLRQAMGSAASHTYSCCAAPQQYATTEFLSDTEACADFMLHTRRILKTVAEMCVSKLRSVGVKVQPAEAGYYIFPDFGEFTQKLNNRKIFTGQEFCNAVLDEAKVALLPGGPTHLRPNDEFTVRLCYINFDGTKALEASRNLTLEKDLPDSFVQEYCMTTVEAIEALVEWCQSL